MRFGLGACRGRGNSSEGMAGCREGMPTASRLVGTEYKGKAGTRPGPGNDACSGQ